MFLTINQVSGDIALIKIDSIMSIDFKNSKVSPHFFTEYMRQEDELWYIVNITYNNKENHEYLVRDDHYENLLDQLAKLKLIFDCDDCESGTIQRAPQI